MALTETLDLDIRAAQAQISALETQLDALSQPIDVPVRIDSGGIERAADEAQRIGDVDDSGFRDIAAALDDTEDNARELARQMRNAGTATSETATQARNLGGSFDGVVRQVAGIAAGVIGIRAAVSAARSVLSAGFARFTTIENSARAMTIQLNDAAAGAELLASVLDVVRGTPFNLDQFAQAATQLVAFGVEARKVPEYLTAIGEAAATRGAQAGEFVDRLVTVFGQVTTQGRLTGEHINRLGEAGVNALAILANSFEVTTEEMRRMVSQGAIPAEEALAFLTTGIIEGTDGIAGSTVALGGTMEGLRETLTGAVGGFNAAVARLGASFIEGIAPQLTEGINDISGAIDTQLIPAIAGFSAALSTVDMSGFTSFVAGLPTAASTLATQVSSATGALTSAVGVFTSLATLDVRGVGEQFRQLSDNILSFREAGLANEAIQTMIKTLGTGIDPARALEATLVELGDSVSGLSVEGFEVLAGQLVEMASVAGASAGDWLDLADAVEQGGEAAGFSAAGIEILSTLLRGEWQEAQRQVETDRWNAMAAALTDTGEAAEGAAPGLDDLADGLDAISVAAEQVAADTAAAFDVLDGVLGDIDFGDPATQIGDVIGQLPTALDAAAAAMRDSEGEMRTDFATFLDDLQGELDTRQAFAEGIAELRSMDLDDLADFFVGQGIESSELLFDALDNPAAAQAAEDALDQYAVEIAGSFRSTIEDELQEALDLTVPINLTAVIQALNIRGLGDLAGDIATRDRMRGQEPTGAGGTGMDVTINVQSSGDTSTDAARAAQQINALVSIPQVN